MPGRILSVRRTKQRGAAAVEFALVAPLFFALVFSILEAGWFFFVNSAAEQATATASRLIRTGQAQNATDADGNPVFTREEFYNEICDVVSTFGDCDDQLTVSISRFGSFDALAMSLANPVCRDSDDPTIEGAQYSESDYGAQNEIIAVQICFLYKPVNPALGMQFTKNDDGFREIISTSIFRNEPFEDA